MASLHEHGVDLRIDSAAAQSLPEPGGGAPVFAEDPGEVKGWRHWVNVADAARRLETRGMSARGRGRAAATIGR